VSNVVQLPGGVAEPEWAALLADPSAQQRASEVWHAVVSEMAAAGTLAAINAPQIRRYVLATVMFDRAAAEVDAKGPVITSPRTQSASWNPWWSVLKDADTMAQQHEDKLGLNPRRRGQVAPIKR
jgi:phage terminase small subunit